MLPCGQGTPGMTFLVEPTNSARPRIVVEDAAIRIVLGGVLTVEATAAARELLVDACELSADVVVLDLAGVVGTEDPELLSRLVDVAQRRCWAARRRLDVVATDPDICAILATAGIWPTPGAAS